MRTYSVWNTDDKRWEYYRGPGPSGTHAGSPRVRGRSPLGSAPEQVAWPLPSSAVKIGEGDVPIGRIAVAVSGLPLAGIDTNPVSIGIYLAIAYLAWRILR